MDRLVDAFVIYTEPLLVGAFALFVIFWLWGDKVAKMAPGWLTPWLAGDGPEGTKNSPQKASFSFELTKTESNKDGSVSYKGGFSSDSDEYGDDQYETNSEGWAGFADATVEPFGLLIIVFFAASVLGFVTEGCTLGVSEAPLFEPHERIMNYVYGPPQPDAVSEESADTTASGSFGVRELCPDSKALDPRDVYGALRSLEVFTDPKSSDDNTSGLPRARAIGHLCRGVMMWSAIGLIVVIRRVNKVHKKDAGLLGRLWNSLCLLFNSSFLFLMGSSQDEGSGGRIGAPSHPRSFLFKAQPVNDHGCNSWV